MPVYRYRAMSLNGQVVRNTVEDVNRLSLMKKLKRNNLIPLSVIQTTRKMSPKRKGKRNNQGASEMLKSSMAPTVATANTKMNNTPTARDKINMFIARTRGVKMQDIIVFTQNFYLLKKANFNNIHALSTIIETTENPLLREILEDILTGVEAGESIYKTMEYYEGIFPEIYISMIKSGELSGALTETLEQAVQYLEETKALNKKIKGILVPNIVQFVGILIMLVVGTLFAIPMIQDVFKQVGSTDKLPEITLWFQGFLNWLVAHWYIFAAIIAIAAGSVGFYISTPKGRYNFHYFKYRMPVFGQLIYAIDFSRFMKAVLLNVKSGIRIQEALEISKNVVHNLVLLSIIETSINNVLMGKSWIEPFEQSGLSSPMATEMLKIGMQTDLTVMLEKLLDYMSIDIDAIMQRIMKVLPQIVYIIVGVVLIFFVLVVLVPLIQVYMGQFLFSAAGV